MNQSATCLSVWASAAAATASRSPFWRRPRRLGRSASGEQAWPSASTTRAGAPRDMDCGPRVFLNRSLMKRHRSGHVQLDGSPRSGAGPTRTRGTSMACSPSLKTSGLCPWGRSRRPARPSALKRKTASRSDCRSIPAARAACARLIPSSAFAIASIRWAGRRRGSFLASPRNSDAIAPSLRIGNPRPIPASRQSTAAGNHDPSVRKRPPESPQARGGMRVALTRPALRSAGV